MRGGEKQVLVVPYTPLRIVGDSTPLPKYGVSTVASASNYASCCNCDKSAHEMASLNWMVNMMARLN